MRSFLAAAVIGICFIGQTLAGVLAKNSNSIIAGYEIVELSWKIQAFPNGPNITVNGTVENAIAKVAELNPNWKTDFDFDNRVAAASTDHIPWEEWDTSKTLCGSPWPEIPYLPKNDPIGRGIDYLNHQHGVPQAGPGPGKCGRVSCSYEAAIYWCNDHHEAIKLANFAWIADGAQIIHDKCNHQSVGNFRHLSGQAFNLGNWNVIVREDYTNGC